MAFETLRSNLVDRGRMERYQWVQGIPQRALTVQTLLSTHARHLRRISGEIDLIAGGPPCQGFSSAGRRNGADPRNQLLLQYVKIVSQVMPKFILMENVKGIASKHKASEEAYAEVLLRKLREAGYVCVSRIVKAADCGVPQERPRYIVLGVNASAFPRVELAGVLDGLWDTALESGRTQLLRKLGFTKKRISCREAISDLEVMGKTLEPCPDAPGREQIKYARALTGYQKALHGDVAVMNSMRLAKHGAETKTRFAWIQKHCEAGVNVGGLDIGEFSNKKHTQVVLDAGKPSRTLTTLPDDLIHYSEPRILTVREYARLQSFPDWFKFSGKYTTGGDRRTKECPRYTQIGNAVAPFVAEVLGYAVTQISNSLAKLNIKVTRKPVRKVLPAKVRMKRAATNPIRVWRAAKR
jgi:DNA (cytosine-5)-methyltransferase 1